MRPETMAALDPVYTIGRQITETIIERLRNRVKNLPKGISPRGFEQTGGVPLLPLLQSEDYEAARRRQDARRRALVRKWASEREASQRQVAAAVDLVRSVRRRMRLQKSRRNIASMYPHASLCRRLKPPAESERRVKFCT